MGHFGSAFEVGGFGLLWAVRSIGTTTLLSLQYTTKLCSYHRSLILQTPGYAQNKLTNAILPMINKKRLNRVMDEQLMNR